MCRTEVMTRLLATTCFFFSSRRRHTRCSRDWSSDVCSSDLSCRHTNAQRRTGPGPSIPTAGGVPRALVSGAAAQAILHECLAVGALQALAPGVRAAALHLLLLHAALRGGRAGLTRGRGSGAGGGGRALLGQAALQEGPALGALQSLGCRVRVAARHPLLLAVLMRSLGDGLSGHDRECRTHRHQPCRASHIDSFREQETAVS